MGGTWPSFRSRRTSSRRSNSCPFVPFVAAASARRCGGPARPADHGRPMSDPITILFAGGGTGGHLYPGVAVAAALAERLPGVRPLFLCTERPIDRVILEPTGYAFRAAADRADRPNSVSGLLRFWKSWRETKDLVRQVLAERTSRSAVVGARRVRGRAWPCKVGDARRGTCRPRSSTRT